MAEARLHVTDRNGRRVVAIDKSPFTIGRGAESDLRLAGREVSRDHAEVVTAIVSCCVIAGRDTAPSSARRW